MTNTPNENDPLEVNPTAETDMHLSHTILASSPSSSPSLVSSASTLGPNGCKLVNGTLSLKAQRMR
jgi:hypothetical protein